MRARRYLLAALVLPVFSLCARQPGAAPSGATIAAASLRETSSVSESISMMARLAFHGSRGAHLHASGNA